MNNVITIRALLYCDTKLSDKLYDKILESDIEVDRGLPSFTLAHPVNILSYVLEDEDGDLIQGFDEDIKILDDLANEHIFINIE
jgi:hypothetical protein